MKILGDVSFFHFSGDDDSLVHGIVTQDGLFEGTIHTKTEELYIEPVSRYINQEIDEEPTFHSIIYRVRDVKDPREGFSCASNRLYQKTRLGLTLENNNIQRKKR